MNQRLDNKITRAAFHDITDGNNTKRPKLEPTVRLTKIAIDENKENNDVQQLVKGVKNIFPTNNKLVKPKKYPHNSGAPIEYEYQDAIFQHLMRLEARMSRAKAHYMDKQAHLSWKMRSMLIDWLVSVAFEYQISEQTVHLSVNYLDRFLSSISVIREKFQLVGATAMFIAGKVEEIYPPASKEWAYLTGDTFSVRQIHKMEQLMLKVLNYEMHSPTILDFIRHVCAKHRLDSRTMYLAMYLSELVLLEGDAYLKHVPSELAAASVALARHTLHKEEPWTKKLAETAGYSYEHLSPVVQRQQQTFRGSPFGEHKAIRDKYSSPKYQKVALLKPRVLQLDDDEY